MRDAAFGGGLEDTGIEKAAAAAEEGASKAWSGATRREPPHEAAALK